MFRIIKMQRRIHVVDADGRSVYSPPDFIRLVARSDLQPMAEAFNDAGAYDIGPVMDFERHARRARHDQRRGQ